MYEQIKKQEYASDLQLIVRPSEEQKGYAILDIYSASADTCRAVQTIQTMYGYQRLCVFACHAKDLALVQSGDEAYTVSQGHDDIKAAANVLGSVEKDVVIREIDRNYHGHKKKI